MSNPILRRHFRRGMHDDYYEGNDRVYEGELVITEEPMTISGTINKLVLLFLFLVIGAYSSWTQAMAGMADKVNILMLTGVLVGFVLAIVIVFKKSTARFLAPIYAICEGLFLGGISALFEKIYPGVAVQAVSASFVAFISMLLLYKARIIQCTQRFNAVLLTLISSIALIYLIQIVAGFFGRSIPLIFESGVVGIGFSIFVIIVAALSFIQDFYFIEESSNMMYPKYYEWFGAFGIVITFVWLYLELLRLFAQLNSRR